MNPEFSDTIRKYLRPNGGKLAVLPGDFERPSRKNYSIKQNRGLFSVDYMEISAGYTRDEFGERVLSVQFAAPAYNQAAAIIDALSAHAREAKCDELRITPFNESDSAIVGLALYLHEQPFVRAPGSPEWVEFIKGEAPPVRIYDNKFRISDAKNKLSHLMAEPLHWSKCKAEARWFAEPESRNNALEGIVIGAEGKRLFGSENHAEFFMPVKRQNQIPSPPKLHYRGLTPGDLFSLIEAAHGIYAELPGAHASSIQVIPSEIADNWSVTRLAKYDDVTESNGKYFYTPKHSKVW